MKTLGSVLLMTALGLAQQSKPEPADPNTVLRVETNVVLVDAVVTDKKGAYVRDLKQKDFKVYEDNREQTIKSFSFEADPASPLARQPRYLVLFFDNSTMSLGDQAIARKAAVSFIDANAGPNRLMAIVNYSGALQIAQNFTADAERLKGIVSGLKLPMGPSAGDMSLGRAAADFGARNMILGIRSLAKNLATIPGRKSLVLLTAGFRLSPDQYSDITATIDVCNRSNVAVYPIDVRGLVTGARLIAPESPFKNAMFQGRGPISTGGSPPSSGGRGGNPTGGGTAGGRGSTGTGSSGGTVGRTSTGGTPVMPVTPSRIIVPKIPEGATTNQQLMYMLADGTGGFVIANTNDLVGGMEKIAKEMNEFYLIGYSPAMLEDGKESCHTIHVRVDHGYTIRARSGYCTARAKDVLAQTPTEKTLEEQASSAAAGSVAATLQAPYFFTGANVARVNVAMEMPASSIRFAKEKGKEHSTINVLGIAYKPDGSVAARFSDSVKVDLLDEKEVEEFKQKVYHYENQFDIGAGQYNLKVVFSAGGQNFGKIEEPLVVDSYDVSKFGISALALSSRFVKVAEADQSLEAALMEDRTPLIAQGYQVIPSGSPVFKKTDRFAFYSEIYEPKLVGTEVPKDLMIGIQMRIYDAKGVVKFDSGGFRIPVPDKPGNPAVPFAAMIPTKDFAPGAYKLELTAVDSVQNKFARTASFEIQ